MAVGRGRGGRPPDRAGRGAATLGDTVLPRQFLATGSAEARPLDPAWRTAPDTELCSGSLLAWRLFDPCGAGGRVAGPRGLRLRPSARFDARSPGAQGAGFDGLLAHPAFQPSPYRDERHTPIRRERLGGDHDSASASFHLRQQPDERIAAPFFPAQGMIQSRGTVVQHGLWRIRSSGASTAGLLSDLRIHRHTPAARMVGAYGTVVPESRECAAALYQAPRLVPLAFPRLLPSGEAGDKAKSTGVGGEGGYALRTSGPRFRHPRTDRSDQPAYRAKEGDPSATGATTGHPPTGGLGICPGRSH